jgi:Ala-tRNA(Pro) deacylase
MSPDVKALLDRAGVKYEIVRHAPVYTAQHRAATAHIPGWHVAKVVVVRDGEWFGMAVVPAPAQLDIGALAQLTRRKQLRLAAESEFVHLFPDSEPGAMPPFGGIYGVEVFLDRTLAEAGEIVVPAGNHGEEIRISGADYVRVVNPVIGAIGIAARVA